MRGLPDSILIKYVKEGNELAFDHLFRRYEPLIKRIAKKYYVHGFETEDFYQIGAVAFYRAILSYEENETTTFYSYVLLCVRNEIVSQFRKQLLKIEYATANEDIAIVMESYKIEKSEIIDEENDDVLHAYRTKLAKLLSESEFLSPLERKCLKGFIDGLSYLEIAKKHGFEIKKVDNALVRIRSKFKERGIKK